MNKPQVGEACEASPKGRIKGIAVLGSHPDTVMQAPFDDDWLIYSCSPHNYEMRTLPRWDEWFEIHKPIGDATRAYPYLKFLETVPLVWMRDEEAMPHFKGGRSYPEAQMKEIFGPFTFTSSIAFIQAKAIVDCCGDELWRLSVPSVKKVNEMLEIKLPDGARKFYEMARGLYDKYGEFPPIPKIGLWGIMQASQTEYAYQRPGIQNLLREATERQIKVMAPDVSRLFEPPVEGF